MQDDTAQRIAKGQAVGPEKASDTSSGSAEGSQYANTPPGASHADTLGRKPVNETVGIPHTMLQNATTNAERGEAPDYVPPAVNRK